MEEPIKIIAAVEFNDHEAYVLNRPVEFKYNRYKDSIIGMDGPIINSYFFERPTPGFRAFAGSKFTITLEDGEEIKCDGQWWGGVNSSAREILGSDLCSIKQSDTPALLRCYVFCGCYVIASEMEKLMAAYTGPVYGYWEYEKIIKARESTLNPPDHATS